MEQTVCRMADSIFHRGPDDSGSWTDEQAGIAFGFRRLAIIDLTETGHQPMHSADGRYVIIYNGEVYNFLQLRQELIRKGHAFRGTSDTEVMLACMVEWGVENAIPHFNGMFAAAVWDRHERCLYLIRDRLGIKPLYYGKFGSHFLFGSELKALQMHPAFEGSIDRQSLTLFLRHNCIPAPYTIYTRVHKLAPGTLLRIEMDKPDQICQPRVYWSAKEMAEEGTAKPFQGTLQDAVGELEMLLHQSVRERMISDVPLGAFLSGGVDSSTIVAVMQSESSRPIKTFTIGFNDDDFNEARYAAEVARHLGTDHTELFLNGDQAREIIPMLPQIYDEPFSDSSQIPTYLVSAMARRHVTVSLTGDGGDELFAGYNRHFYGRKIWQRIGWVPQGIRSFLAAGAQRVSPLQWDNLFNKFNLLQGDEGGLPEQREKIKKFISIISSESPEAVYRRLSSHWEKPSEVVLGASEPQTILTDRSSWADLPDFTLRMMFLDLVTYLPDDIFTKVDRASMAVSLESRAPFLDDHRLVEFAWRIPLSYKIQEGQGKWVLRKLLDKYIPGTLFKRPKMGFAIPIDNWLRGPLRNWAESLLNETTLRNQGFFNPVPIRQKWDQHLSGQWNWQYELWDVLMFQAWLNHQQSGENQ